MKVQEIKGGRRSQEQQKEESDTYHQKPNSNTGYAEINFKRQAEVGPHNYHQQAPQKSPIGSKCREKNTNAAAHEKKVSPEHYGNGSNLKIHLNQHNYFAKEKHTCTNKKAEVYTIPQHQNTKNQITTTMADTDISDEEFLARFAAMNPVELPPSTVRTRDWAMCVLARVVTDKSVIEANFQKIMVKAWEVDPETEITMVAKNIFLIQFVLENDLLHVLHRGLWNYREDAIATSRVYGPADLEVPEVKNVAINTQWHKIPVDAVTKEGILNLATTLGTPLSEVTETCTAGSRCYKVRLLLPIDKPLQDSMEVTHPTGEAFKALLVYERVNRICFYCSRLGHDQSLCADKMRMERLQQDPKYKDRVDITSMLKKRVGLWVNNQSMIPTNRRTRASMNPGLNHEQRNNPNDSGPEQTPQALAQERVYRSRGIKIGGRERSGEGTVLNMDLNESGLQMGLDPNAKNKGIVVELAQHYQQGSLKRGGSGRDPNPIEYYAKGPEETHSTGNGSQGAEDLHASKKRLVEASHGPSPPQP